jgi:glutamine phosphoribosylpyrophosphate amidotransferase
VVLSHLDFTIVRDIEPAEVIFISFDGQYIHPIVTLPPLNTVSGYAVYPALAIVDQFL